MTISSGFFNSHNHDRLYDAEQLSSIFDGILIDGVYENYGDAFMITANPEANSSVLVGTGRAWFDHTWTLNDSTYALQLDPPNEMLGRIDAIVIDVDRSDNVRKNNILYLKGSEATEPQAPDLINTDLHNQYPIAFITRDAGADGPVGQEKINYVVGTSTPIVTSVLEAQNLDNMWQQLEAEFNLWWDNVKATLDENTVTNLQNQIDEIKEKLDSEDALVGLLEKPIAEAFMSGDYHIGLKNFTVPNAGGFFPFMSFLPDGYVVTVSAETNRQITVNIVNSNGVNTPSTHTIPTISESDLPSGNQYRYWYDRNHSSSGLRDWTYPFNDASGFNNAFLFMETTSYPAKICVAKFKPRAVSAIYGAGSPWQLHNTAAYIIMISISASHVVNFTDYGPIFDNMGIPPSHEISSGYPSGGANSADAGGTKTELISFCEPNDSDEKIFGYNTWGGTFDTYTQGINLWKVSKNGAYSNPGHYTYISNANSYNGVDLYIASNGNNFRTIYASGGLAVGKKIYSKIDIDGNTLVASFTDMTSTPETVDKDYYDYISENNISSYTLSEQNGLVETKITEENPHSSVAQSKVMNYFVGASNLGGSIPEGSYFPYVYDERYYGIGPNGAQIAIGKNGGAAILKKTLSVDAFSINGVYSYFNGVYELDGTKSYILAGPNKNQIGAANKVSGSVRSIYREE